MPRRLAVALVVLALLGIPAFTTDPYWLHVLIMSALNVSLALSLRVLWNVGVLSCGHAALMGVGAYASALLATRTGASAWLGLFVGAGAAVVVAVGLGYLSLRLRGIYFVLVTFAFNEVFFLVVNRWRDVTGGPSGIVGIPRFTGLPPGRAPYYYLALGLLALTVVVLHRLERSHVGRIWFAIRDADLRAQCVGINTVFYRVLAFVTSAVFAGAWGAFYAHYQRVVAPTDFTVWQSVYLQLYMIVGGAAAFTGPILGGATLTIVTELIRATGPLVSVIYGILLTSVMLFLPGGLVSLRAGLASARWRHSSKSTA
ncbi:MAG TPA: branched-chain amino acid ABC transporter permease [Candidatus Methylomirabilis sp.]|nr:branched-chain amino acid ABC transporter permease [Candidatus Methylomirabilis sp.]